MSTTTPKLKRWRVPFTSSLVLSPTFRVDATGFLHVLADSPPSARDAGRAILAALHERGELGIHPDNTIDVLTPLQAKDGPVTSTVVVKLDDPNSPTAAHDESAAPVASS